MGRLVKPGKKAIVADRGFLGMVDERAKKRNTLILSSGLESTESVVLREAIAGGNRHDNRDRIVCSVVGRGYDTSHQRIGRYIWDLTEISSHYRLAIGFQYLA